MPSVANTASTVDQAATLAVVVGAVVPVYIWWWSSAAIEWEVRVEGWVGVAPVEWFTAFLRIILAVACAKISDQGGTATTESFGVT